MVQKISQKRRQIVTFIVLSVYAFLLAKLVNEGYFISWLNMFFCLTILGLGFVRKGPQTFRYRFLGLSIFFVGLNYFNINYSFQYLGIISCVLFCIESLNGRLHWLTFPALLISSPIFNLFTNIFSFPIRIKLSKWTVELFGIMGLSAESEGNMIAFNGNYFSVDPACMGLRMLAFSLLFCVFLLLLYEKKLESKLPFWLQFSLLIFTFLLTIGGNLLRIIFLIRFNIQPENPFHEMAGIFVLLIYVWLPLIFLSKKIYNRYGNPVTKNKRKIELTNSTTIGLNLFLLFTMFWLVKPKPFQVSNSIQKIEDYEAQKLQFGITQYSNDESLVYIKPMKAFYSSDHNPEICWKGSGFTLSQIETKIIGGNTVFIGQLKKKDAKLISAWWYSSAKSNTTSQMDWRWSQLTKREKYKLINITAESIEVLEKAVKQWDSISKKLK